MSPHLIRILLLVAWVGILFLFADLGTFNIDEVHYLLAAQRFATEGSFAIPNGFAEFRHDLMLFFHPQPLEVLPEQTELTTFIPPLYTFPAALFYAIAGLVGLFVMNAIAFVVAVILAMRLAELIAPAEHRESAQWLTLAAFIGGGFFSGYAVAIVNHALTLALVLAAICLHPLLRDAKDTRALLLTAASGLLIGFAFGVRLQHIITIAALGFFCLADSRRPIAHLFAFMAGLVVPILSVVWINQLRFGSWNPLSYGVSAQAKLVPLLGQIASSPTLLLTASLGAIAVILLLAVFHKPLSAFTCRRIEAASQSSNTLVIIAASAPLILLLLPPLGGHFAERVIGLFPLADPESEWRGGLLPYFAIWNGVRSPLLASAPLVLCGLLSPFLLPTSMLTRRFWMLWGIAWSHVLFVCLLTNNGGYFMNQRYLMEAASLALVLFAVTACSALGMLPRNALLVGAALAIGVSMLLLYVAIPGRTLGAPTTDLDLLLGRFLPLIFSAGAFIAFLLHLNHKPMGPILLGIVLPYCLFIPLVLHAWYDIAHEHEYRRTRREVAEALAPLVRDRSLLIVYGGQREPAGRLKEHTDVWIADALRTQWQGVPELIEATQRNNWRSHIFLVDTGMPDETRQWLQRNARVRLVAEEPLPLYEIFELAEAETPTP